MSNEADQEAPQKDDDEYEDDDEVIEFPDPDPLLQPQSQVVREGDYVILAFGDGRQIFAQVRLIKTCLDLYEFI